LIYFILLYTCSRITMFKALQFFPWMKSKKPMKKIVLGVCAMDKKSKSKPMKEILSRLPPEEFEIVIFGNDCIFNTAIEDWPVVEILITFYSTGFPTQKALDYIKLRSPYLLNDLEMDSTLKDRRKVYDLLKSQGINVPHHVYVSRDAAINTNVVEEFDEVGNFNLCNTSALFCLI
jgi:inositol-hexakisphosphate/diphosphoinositol-pentakisphosphate 1-kinase